MDIENTRKQILEYISNLDKIDLGKLFPLGNQVTAWHKADSKEIENYVKNTVDFLERIKQNPEILRKIPFNNLQNIRNNLEQFFTHYDPLKNLDYNQITSHHHNPLNNLRTIDELLRRSGIYAQLLISPDLDSVTKKVSKARLAVDKFDEEKFNQALELIEKLNQQKSALEEKTIKEHLGTFIHRANEHKIYQSQKFLSLKKSGQWWWLFFAIISGLIVAYFVDSFLSVLEDNGAISIGASILRISSLIIPSYFLVFFVNQFLYHKRMYEIYSFKNSALNTMTNLMTTNKDKADKILEKGLNILFSEPRLQQGGGKYDKQLVSELLTMLRDQLNK